MIKDNNIEVVIVTSIDCTHHLYIASAMKLGCDVITEKPLTTQISYCDFIFKAIKDYEKKLTVTFNYRYTPRNAKIKELRDSLDRFKKENNECYNRIADLTESLESKDYFKDPDYKYLIEENQRLEQERNELLVVNKRLNRDAEEKLDRAREAGL